MTLDLIFIERIDDPSLVLTPQELANANKLSLPFERRQIARQRVALENGQAAGLKLPRGIVLREGDVLRSAGQQYVRIEAAPEHVSRVQSHCARELARAAYHLGNRHVWVQVGDQYLRYLHDHVLDDMLAGLGLSTTTELAPFEPEAGAYTDASGHSHGGKHHSH